MMPESISDRARLSQKLASVKQTVAQSITDEFFSTIPSGRSAMGNAAASSALRTRAFIWSFSLGPSRPARPARLAIIHGGLRGC
jgi:hypothetical protein